MMSRTPPAVGYALLAAALFGASAPLAKIVLGDASPVLIAGLLYLGSGIGLAVWIAVRRLLLRHEPLRAIARADLPWLGGAVVAGGMAGPVLLMSGLAITDAASASLLLNMESVLTALLAWFVFREHFNRRIFIGMLLIVAAGGLLAWAPAASTGAPVLHTGALLIIAACLCWALDNNLTRKISGNDAVQIAAIKGLVAGSVNVAIALWTGAAWPQAGIVLSTAAIGLAGYGVSLVMFVLALRALGTARTGAYFASAPFVGAALSLLIFGGTPSLQFWLAGALMAVGLWLHLTERHAHRHRHQPLDHTHAHVHDEHHQHTHDFDWDGQEPHTHRHHHDPLLHDHPHYPDLHHRHRH
ncbi:MAG: DMT family transporter [Lacisediminimonas sp.]|nr:DMT family transporter [Lacisediminimonas sp.]MDO9218898.1 DMT family transporter [Lacisediminimonas sp.]